MPSVSGKQHRAMAAAAGGKSTLGIPAKVGREFMKADSYSTGGTMSGSVGNPEYRHDPMYKSVSRQTRGTDRIGYATGHGSRNRQTPSNYYVQDGAMKMQRCIAQVMRHKRARGSVSSHAFGKYHYHNPHRGGY